MQPKAIIFDLDDTLIDTFNYVHFYMQQYSKSFGFTTPSKKKLKGVWGKRSSEIVSALWPQANVDHYWEVASYFRQSNGDKLTTHNGAAELLKDLKKANIYLGLFTNARMVWAEWVLKKYNLFKYFDYIQTEENTKFHKPHPNSMEEIIKELKLKGINKEEVIYIGDSLIDYFTAKNSGIKFYGILTGPFQKDDFPTESLPEATFFPNLSEVKKEVLSI